MKKKQNRETKINVYWFKNVSNCFQCIYRLTSTRHPSCSVVSSRVLVMGRTSTDQDWSSSPTTNSAQISWKHLVISNDCFLIDNTCGICVKQSKAVCWCAEGHRFKRQQWQWVDFLFWLADDRVLAVCERAIVCYVTCWLSAVTHLSRLNCWTNFDQSVCDMCPSSSENNHMIRSLLWLAFFPPVLRCSLQLLAHSGWTLL
jgi:hypothetical protein